MNEWLNKSLFAMDNKHRKTPMNRNNTALNTAPNEKIE